MSAVAPEGEQPHEAEPHAEEEELEDVSDLDSDEDDDAAEAALLEKLNQLEKKKLEVQAVAASGASEVDKKKASDYKWGTYLMIAPFGPALMALLTIFWGGITLNSFPTTCVSDLKTFVAGAIGISYIFLFFLSFVYVGPKPYKSFRPLKLGYGAIAFVSVGVFAYGTMEWTKAAACLDTAPQLYVVSSACIVMFWGSAGLIALYALKDKLHARHALADEKRRKLQEAVAAKVARDEANKAKKAAKKQALEGEREKEKGADAKATERAAFYGESTDDES